jgi:hypothetical protein
LRWHSSAAEYLLSLSCSATKHISGESAAKNGADSSFLYPVMMKRGYYSSRIVFERQGSGSCSPTSTSTIRQRS